MSKQKYLVSSLSMIMMLFLVASYMFVTIQDLTLFASYSISNDISFLLMSCLIIIVVAVVVYVIPMFIVFELNVNLKLTLSPNTHYSYKVTSVYKLVKNESRRYLRLNVIRC